MNAVHPLISEVSDDKVSLKFIRVWYQWLIIELMITGCLGLFATHGMTGVN